MSDEKKVAVVQASRQNVQIITRGACSDEMINLGIIAGRAVAEATGSLVSTKIMGKMILLTLPDDE